ncbi:hypothetical protein ACLB2K_051031 [Fragaria x ananassa]
MSNVNKLQFSPHSELKRTLLIFFKSIINKINKKMTRIVFLLFILATWTALANCARPHVQPLNPETDEMRSSTAPSTSPSSPDCTKAIYAMSDCIPFLSEGIQTTSPERSCCSGYETVVKSGPVCVCQSFEGTADMGIRLNMTKAMTLSSACGIKNAPPRDNCNDETKICSTSILNIMINM